MAKEYKDLVVGLDIGTSQGHGGGGRGVAGRRTQTWQGWALHPAMV